jgi:Asp-tRNA(Asn)/Glu-tRNA(Gln) amidotransferase A subunit family amidase
MKAPHELSATQAAACIARGELTSAALVESCLERIAAREGLIGAWEHLDPEQALVQARERDRTRVRGPLHGIPVGIKDIIATVDMPTGYGSPIYRGWQPAWDAACVAALRAAGAVIMGKTVTTEFAVYQPGRTANPHNPGHTPGGSSSGSAAAVADLMVPLALGTQTAGSIIRPASFCGVVGCKPTFGYIDRAGLKPCAESLDTIGVFARSINDAALALAVLSGRPELAAAETPTAAPRVGFCRTHEWPLADKATELALASACEALLAAGATLVGIALPQLFSGLADAQALIQAYETSRALAYESREHAAQLSPSLLALIQAGREFTPTAYDRARDLAGRCRAALPALFDGIDIMLAPSVKGEAPAGLDATGDPVFNRIWTLLHVPCLNLPAIIGPAGLPVGVQLVGPLGSDARTLRMARWVEQVLQTHPQ